VYGTWCGRALPERERAGATASDSVTRAKRMVGSSTSGQLSANATPVPFPAPVGASLPGWHLHGQDPRSRLNQAIIGVNCQMTPA